VAHKLRQLPDVARVGLQEPGSEGAPQIVGLEVSLLDAALPDPPVQPAPQGVLGDPGLLLAEEEVAGGASPARTNSSRTLR
jgi:hypothetical protein